MRRLAAVISRLLFAAGCAAVRPPSSAAGGNVADDRGRDPEAGAAAAASRRGGPASGDEAVTIDTSQHFQKMHGFGAAMTDASARSSAAFPTTSAKRSWPSCSAAERTASGSRSRA